MDKLNIETLNNDIMQLIITSEFPTGNHFELHYDNIDMYSVVDWMQLWGYNLDNELEVAGNYIKFLLNGELHTYELQEFYFNELCKRSNG